MLGTWIYLLLILIVFGVFYVWRKSQANRKYWINQGVNFFDSTTVISNLDRLLLRYRIDEIESKIYNSIKKEGIKDYVGVIEFGAPTFYVVDLDLVKNILIKDFDSFVDRRILISEDTDPIFGKMLANMKGQQWKDMRATMSPTFSTGKIRRMYSVFNDSSEKLREFLHREIHQNGSDLEFRGIVSKYTTDVISSAAFGLESNVFKSEDSEFSYWANRFQNNFSGFAAYKFLVIFIWPGLLRILRIPFFDANITNFFSGIFKKAIKYRESTGEKRNDFLQLLIEARNNNPESIQPPSDELSTFEKEAQILGTTNKIQFTDDVMLSQGLLFFIAGLDTTETAIVMAAYELAKNPEIQEKLYESIKSGMEENNGELSYDLVMKLEYLDMVVSETLRMYSPGIRLERKVTKPYTIPDTNITLEQDLLVVIPMYGIHMDERYFPNPSKFDPERFTPENKAKRHPYAYLPFGGGPRNCIAMRFALAETKAAIAHLILNFKLEPNSKTEIPMKFKKMAAFKAANGLWLKVTSRN